MRRMVNAMEFLNVRRARAAGAVAVRLVGYLSIVVVGSISYAQHGAGDQLSASTNTIARSPTTNASPFRLHKIAKRDVARGEGGAVG
jgi:hypothetical protein